MQLTITPLADAGAEVLPPDIVWNGTSGDFAISTDPAEGGVGGLVAAHPLTTALIMLLFTDGKADAWELLPEHGGDARGWIGDSFDLDTARGEAALGSKLWLYRRSILNDRTGTQMANECVRALQPLIDEGAAAKIVATPTVDQVGGRVLMQIGVYGRDGTVTYSAEFDMLWRRTDGV
ncbi:Mu-like prophage protein gp46 [Faunimonas pinastri]|uniref:Mu-like prophage protein gp46 n=1 Tax=Faunimonas pinastri TaxID=1855383 RepID=A0A1H9GEH4_9HYPH|nr:phage GP46 family protein [Faunimonas pinastri]SEQ48188.1 Mu-like prophage protein gp46 [Faunimonas pinastri]